MKSYELKKLLKNLNPHIKVDEKIIKFDNTEIGKCKFHPHKKSILIKILIK